MEISWTNNEDGLKNALSCPLEKIFKFYGLNINKYNSKTICPFKNHKGGRESTASFYFYNKTNTYWCFGCKQGSSVIDFVMNYENISFPNALEKINNLFKYKYKKQEDNLEEENLFDLKLKLSNLIRENKNEEVMKIYDSINEKYDLDEKAELIMIKKLINKMEG